MDRIVHILKMAKFHYKFGGDDEGITIEDLRNTKILLYDKAFSSHSTNGFKFMTMSINLLMNFKLSKNNPITAQVLEMAHAQ